MYVVCLKRPEINEKDCILTDRDTDRFKKSKTYKKDKGRQKYSNRNRI